MPLQEFIVGVLGNTLKAPFYMDEKVKELKTPITLHMSQKTSPQKALEMVIEILRKIGLEIGARADTLYILAKEKLPIAAENVTIGRQVPFSPVTIAQVVPLRYLKADEITPLILTIFKAQVDTAQPETKTEAASSKPEAPETIKKPSDTVTVNTYKNENSLVLTGPANMVKEIVSFVNLLDVPYIQEKKVAILELLYWNSEEFISQMKRILEGLNYRVASSQKEPGIMLIPITFLNSVIVVAPDEPSLRFVINWKDRLDTVENVGEEQKIYTYTPKYSKAAELVESIEALYSLVTPNANATEKQDTKKQDMEKQQNANKSGKNAGVNNINSDPSLPNASSTAALSSLSSEGSLPIERKSSGSTNTKTSFVSDELRMSADERRNVVLMITTANTYRELLSLLKEIDTPPKQVLLETVIAEVSLDASMNTGFAWFLKNSILSGDAWASSTPTVFDPLKQLQNIGFTFQYIADSEKVAAVLNLLEQESKLEILSKPSIMVLNNEEATIQVGNEVPIITSEVSREDTSNSINRNIQYRTAGVILRMRPTVNAEGLVTIDLLQEVSEAQTTTTSNIDSPTFLKRRIDTSVVAGNGQTVILGGLMSRTNETSETKVPFVGDIPIIGNAFKTKQNNTRKTELVVLITPRILSNVDETSSITKEIRQI
ncbi:general secretion pathway protein D [Candidatus Magnetoovum chiemensis]|nr:general secretion pathway protein D [Candidatus Magnetoovum chiemensis]